MFFFIACRFVQVNRQQIRTMSDIPDKRNIEIKARIQDAAEYKKRVDIAKDLTKTDGEIIPQRDVFFNVTNGRLKLRYLTVKTKTQCFIFII